MKVSNETKVGALTAISITLLILGFNYLKGKNLLSKAKTEVYAVFQRVDGLTVSAPVTINGLPIGKIYEMQEKDRSLSGVVVTINLTKDIDIPKNSFASINKDLLGGATVSITLGDAKDFAKNGDTLSTLEVGDTGRFELPDLTPGMLRLRLEPTDGSTPFVTPAFEI